MLFQKSDLQNTHYLWNADLGERFIGEPTRRLFNRYDGEQVLFILNYYAKLEENCTVDKLQAMEKVMERFLPLNAMSEITVVHWLQNSKELTAEIIS